MLNKEKTKQVLDLAENQQLVSVNDLRKGLGWSLATAQRYLLELEIAKELERVEHVKESGYTFKYWRLVGK